MKKEEQEWITTIRLSHYKWLCNNTSSLDDMEKSMLIKIKQLLLDDGITEETINQEVWKYSELNEEERKKQMKEKAEELVLQITSYLENVEEISSKDYPELYYRIQELLALDPHSANELIKEVFAQDGINHCMNCNNSLFGEPCTYYFSKKLSYK